MNIINEIANTFKATNIHEEVSMLRNEAIDMISPEDISAVILKDNLASLAVLATGTYPVITPEKDDRGQVIVKQQAWNDILWTITIHTLVEHDGLNSVMLGNIIHAWSIGGQTVKGELIKNSLIELPSETAHLFADKYVAELQMMGCISSVPQQKHSVVDGIPRTDMVFGLTPEYITYVQGIKKDLAKTKTMRFQPLTHKPVDWTDNFTGIGKDANAKLIKGSSKKHVSKHVLSAVNKLQSVPYVIHADMHKLASLVVANENDYRVLWGYSVDDWKEIILAWRAVKQLKVGQTYYFSVTMDFRGRMYYRGGLVTPQGADFAKATFIFQRSLPLGRFGFGALCNSLANALDMKGSQLQKIQRVEEGMKSGALSSMLADFKQFCTNFPKVDHCQAYVLGKEVLRAYEHKLSGQEYDTFSSPVPCHADGTCNGLQHQAAITGCQVTARATNMTASSMKDAPSDVYGLVMSNCTLSVLSALSRDYGKNPVMIGSYGASLGTISRNMYNKFNKDGIAWNTDYPANVWESMVNTVPALVKVTDACGTIAQGAMAHGNEITWTTYDGFEVTQQYISNEANIIRGGSFNAVCIRHDATLGYSKMATALSPNFIHSIDSTHLRCTINAINYDVVAIHDSIATHACNYYACNKVLRKQMHAVHTEYDHLANLCESNGVDKPVFEGTYNITEVLDACNMFG